jgi:hypothetical protein
MKNLAIIILLAFAPVAFAQTQLPLGAECPVGYGWDIYNDGSSLLTLGPSVGKVVVFDDLYSDYSKVRTFNYLSPFEISDGNLVFVFTGSSVVSMVYLYNATNSSASLVVNGVIRDSWDPFNGYHYNKSKDFVPLFTEDVNWKYRLGR